MIPYSRLKRSDLYTLYGRPPPPPPGGFPLRETELRSKQKTMGQWVRGEANGDSTPKES